MERSPCYWILGHKHGVDLSPASGLVSWRNFMGNHRRSQGPVTQLSQPAVAYETVIPNPKLKLLDQMREVMRLKHYSIRTERTYCDPDPAGALGAGEADAPGGPAGRPWGRVSTRGAGPEVPRSGTGVGLAICVEPLRVLRPTAHTPGQPKRG